MKKVIIAAAFGVVLYALPGCFAVPFIESYKQMGVSQSDRQRLLDERVTLFHRELYWGRSESAVAFAVDEARDTLWRDIRDRKKKEKLVEANVEFISFNEDSSEAEVEVSIRYYKVPYYIVQDRVENQKWQFSLADGWKYAGLAPVTG